MPKMSNHRQSPALAARDTVDDTMDVDQPDTEEAGAGVGAAGQGGLPFPKIVDGEMQVHHLNMYVVTLRQPN